MFSRRCHITFACLIAGISLNLFDDLSAAPVAETPKVISRTISCEESEEVIRAVVRAVIDSSRELGGYCDEQNLEQKSLGKPFCPTGTCMSLHEVGGWSPPTLEIKISNSSTGSFSMGGMSSGGPMSGGPGSDSPSTGSPFGSSGAPSFAPSSPLGASSLRVSSSDRRSLAHRLSGPVLSSQPFTVSLTLRMALAKNPDKLQCVNPMSQSVRDQLLSKVMDLAISNRDLCRANS